MSDPVKFNDAAGTNEQQICQNHCDDTGFNDPATTPGGIQDSPRAEMGRRDSNGADMDVCYTLENGVADLCNHFAKCWSCPHWLIYKAQLES